MSQLDSSHEMTRSEVAEYLREFAAQLDTAEGEAAPTPGQPNRRDARPNDGRVTFMVGSDSTTINPPDHLTFEVEVDSDTSFVGGERRQAVDFELTWDVEEDEDDGEDELEIR
ncbi:amphi-Trp domain-containing protein [Haloarcula marina]|uniref:amphi-Trp domain-containing protein n=1 Tax=Haloarcula marina TaxID=2961574 RepID=UPI0020B77308|nr:amphi-Trp domain-containing protein [Halomicroarcula marina]